MNGNTVLMYIYYPGHTGHFALGALLPEEHKVLYADSSTSEARRDHFFQTMRKFLAWIKSANVVDLDAGKSKSMQQTFVCGRRCLLMTYCDVIHTLNRRSGVGL